MIGTSPALSTPLTLKRVSHYLYNTQDLLGKGNFSRVYAGTNELTSQPVAIKVIELESIKNPKLLELHRNELDVLTKLNHPNCIRCHDIVHSDHHCFIVTEMCNGGDLDILAKKKGTLTEAQVAPILRDILEGLIYLASLGVVHRDLKIANVFLHNNQAKIADFGFAVISKQKFEDLNIGSPLYMSPEGYVHCIYGPKTDVWAFGILIYELLHGDTPYSHCKLESDLRKHLSFPFDRTKIKSSISPDLREVILRCLEIMEPKRISVYELRETIYFKRIYMQLSLSSSPQEQSLFRHTVSGDSLESKRFKSIDNLYGQQLNAPIKSPERENLPNSNRQEFQGIKVQEGRHPPGQRLHLLHTPQQIVRLGRPISTAKRQENLSPEVIRERFGSIDSKKPQQPYVIVTAHITFKVAINMLHYCRCMYRYCQLFMRTGEDPKDLRFLAGWLMLVLEELKRKINEEEILFEGTNKEKKANKLREVRADYERKYSEELKEFLTGFLNKPTLQEVKNFFFLRYRKYDFLIGKEKQGPFCELGFFSVLLYDASRLIAKCQDFGDFVRFASYRDLQEALQYPREKFNHQLFGDIRRRIVLNN